MERLIKLMYTKFGFAYEGPARALPTPDFEFRIKAFNEEIAEYELAVAENDLEGQFDALLDLLVFNLGAMEQHGFPVREGFERVMAANLNKEVVKNTDESKRGFKLDLKKPEGWRAPYLDDLIKLSKNKGIIILDGPDACGKTYLADYLVKHYNAHYMHSTWSPELEKNMANYLDFSACMGSLIAKNQLVILDRHWLSDLVYADVFRGGSDRGKYYEHAWEFLAPAVTTVICLPSNMKNVVDNFDDMKDSRTEMYEDMFNVAKAYDALWRGEQDEYIFKNSSHVQNVMDMPGGLGSLDNFIRYDWTKDGKDIQNFIDQNNLVQEKDFDA